MKETKRIVLLKDYTPDPENAVAEMARICYADDEKLQEIFSPSEIDCLEDSKLVRALVNSRHWSQLEYANYRFIISGVSRSLTHQLVRHRMASFSQRSQRYVEEGNFESVVPPTVASDRASLEVFNGLIGNISEGYNQLIELGVPKEDARYILPNACSSVIGVQMNARELLSSFFKERLCERAQWEIRGLAKQMLSLVYPTAPHIFEIAGPSCVIDGRCYQGKRGCGKISDVKASFRVGGEYKR